MHLVFVMIQCSIRHRTDIAFFRICCRGMVWGKDTRDGANNRADGLIHGLLFRSTDNLGKSRARFGVRKVGGIEDAGVLVEPSLMMVICGSLGDRTNKARLIHVELGVFGRENGVGGAHHWADFGSHDAGR